MINFFYNYLRVTLHNTLLLYIVKNQNASAFSDNFYAKFGVLHTWVYNEIMKWDLISDVILVASIASLAVFVFLGIYQLFACKSLLKVDRRLLWMIFPLLLMAITYIIFDKLFVLNVRPNGSGETSFPSTHVMVVATIFMLIAINLPYYIKSKAICILLDLAMLALLVLVCVGRVLSEMHWLSDVLGGLAFALIFAFIYYLIIRRKNHA